MRLLHNFSFAPNEILKYFLEKHSPKVFDVIRTIPDFNNIGTGLYSKLVLFGCRSAKLPESVKVLWLKNTLILSILGFHLFLMFSLSSPSCGKPFIGDCLTNSSRSVGKCSTQGVSNRFEVHRGCCITQPAPIDIWHSLATVNPMTPHPLLLFSLQQRGVRDKCGTKA